MIDVVLIIEEIQNIIQEVNICEEKEENDIGNECCLKVIMVFCEVDFIVVYYDFFQGFVLLDLLNEEEDEVKFK